MTGFLTRDLPQNETLRRIGGGTLTTGPAETFSAFTGIETATSLIRRQIGISDLEEDTAGVPFEGGELPGQGPLVPKKDVPRVAPEVLNEQYKDIGLTFDEPMTAEAARLIADARRAEVIRNDIASRAEGPAAVGAAFAGGLIATAMDPLEAASAFVPVVSQARTAGLISRFGAVRGRALVGATEGTVGAALFEPVIGGLSRQQQLDYGMSDALLNIGLGAAFGTAAGSVFGLAARRQFTSSATKLIDENLRASGADAPFGADVPATRIRQEDLIPESVRIMSAQQKLDAHRAAIAQFVQGKDVDVSPMVRRRQAAPEGVETLNQWISRTGGVNDASPSFRGEIDALGDRNIRGPDGKFTGRLSRADAARDLDDLAEQAVEEGFIKNRDPLQLLDAIDRELRGDPVVRLSDEPRLRGLADAQTSRQDAEQFLARFDSIRKELDEAGIRDATPDEIDRVDEIMRESGVTAEDAFERVAIERAEEVARREAAPEREGVADFESSAEVDRLLADVGEFDDDIPEFEAMVEQMRAADELSPEDVREISQVADLDSKVEAVERTASQAAACMSR